VAIQCQDFGILVGVVLKVVDGRLGLRLTDGCEMVLSVAGVEGLAVGRARRLAGVVFTAAVLAFLNLIMNSKARNRSY